MLPRGLLMLRTLLSGTIYRQNNRKSFVLSSKDGKTCLKSGEKHFRGVLIAGVKCRRSNGGMPDNSSEGGAHMNLNKGR